MKIILQVLFGALLGAVGLVVCFYLGILLNGRPDWRTGVASLLILLAAQGISFIAFHYGVVLQVLVGLILCLAVAWVLLYSNIPMFWEHEIPAQSGVYAITWRSRLFFLALLTITQWAAFLAFRKMKRPAAK